MSNCKVFDEERQLVRPRPCLSALPVACALWPEANQHSSQDVIPLSLTPIVPSNLGLQELVLSIDPWIQIRLQRVRWDLFSDILNFCSRDGSPNGAHNILSIVKFRNTLSLLIWQKQLSDDANSAARLLELLDSRRGLGATDPRDMIYGHLGVLGTKKPGNRLDSIIRVDYNQPVSELFTQVALYMISARKGFDIFSHVEDIPIERRTQFPTWVPDWTYPYSPRSGVAWLGSISSTADVEQLYVSPSVRNPQVLGLLGRYVGTIEIVLDSKPPRVDLEAICESSRRHAPNIYNDRISIIYRILLNRLSEWFKEQGLAQLASSALVLNYYDGIPPTPKSTLYNWIKAHFDHPSQPLGPTPIIDDFRLNREADLLIALLLGMTDKSGSGSFPGDKIAIDENGTLIIVPRRARKGDYVCQFCPDPKRWILRTTLGTDREELDGNLMEYFKTLKQDGLRHSISWLGRGSINPYTANMTVSNLNLVIEHVNLIGECRGERAFMEGLTGLLNPEPASLFALH